MTEALAKAEPNSLEERTFDKDELVNLLAHAQVLHTLDSTRQGLGKLESIATANQEGITAATVYEVAQELGISRDYVGRAMSIWYPSQQQILADLESQSSTVSEKVIVQGYYRRLERKIQEEGLDDVLDIQLTRSNFFYRLINDFRRNYKISVSLKDNKKKKPIATLRIGTPDDTGKGWYNLLAKVYEPSFFRIFRGIIRELPEEFTKLGYKFGDIEIKNQFGPELLLK